MQELLLIAVGAAFVNNVVLSQFLGICPFLGVSKNVKTAAGMGGAVVFVITIASFVTGLIYKFILGNPKMSRKYFAACRPVISPNDLRYIMPSAFIFR